MEEDAKKLSKGVKIALFFVFAVVWFGLANLLHHSLHAFEEGGWGMWPILMVGMVSIIVMIDRIRYLFFVIPLDRIKFQAEVHKYLMAGDVGGALQYCQSLPKKPLAKVVAAGLAHLNKTDAEVQEAVDEVALREMPSIEVRTGYLAMIGNISTLLGLLGTIVGLIKAFAGVSLSNPNDPAVITKAKQYRDLIPACKQAKGKLLVRCIEQNKATILAAGISEAMNCTAFGLGVGIFSLLGFSVLNGKTQGTMDEIGDASVYLINIAVTNRKTLKLG